MITRLRIRKFGRFVDRTFDFGPVTLFVGPNESGKSTLFDILYQEICHPKGHGASGLKDRYQDERDAALEFDGEPFESDAIEFLNLLAIRSGDIHLELPKKGQWMDRVRSELFSGGVDPTRLADELATLASDRGSLKHVKERRIRVKERQDLEVELRELHAERDRILSLQREVETSEQEVRRLEDELGSGEEQLKVVDRRLHQQTLIRRRKRLRAVLEDLELAVMQQRERDSLATRSGDDRELDALRRHVEDARGKAERFRIERDQRRERLDRLEERHRVLVADLRRQIRRSELAGELRRRLELEAPTVRVRLRLMWLLSVLLPLAVSAYLAVLLSELPLPATIMIVLAGIGLSAGIAALTRGWATGSRAVAEAVRRVGEEWQSRGGEGGLHLSSYEGSIAELARIESGRDTASGIADQAEQELQQERSALQKADRDLLDAQGLVEPARETLRGWLIARGVATEAEFHGAQARGEQLASVMAETAARLTDARERLDCDDDAALRAEVSVQIHNLDGEITQAEVSDREYQRLSTERSRLQSKLESLRSRRARDGDRVAEARGAVRGSLGTLPARILDCETRLSGYQDEIESMLQAQQAAAVAADIFGDLARDSDVLLRELAGNIAESYGAILGSGREVLLDRLALSSVRAVDATGTERGLEQLSTGTRDTFLLAARLTLAAKTRDGDAMIVLDEPFHALDRPRTQRALDLVSRFHIQKGWQIILLSKDPWMVEACKSAFSAVQVVEL